MKKLRVCRGCRAYPEVYDGEDLKTIKCLKCKVGVEGRFWQKTMQQWHSEYARSEEATKISVRSSVPRPAKRRLRVAVDFDGVLYLQGFERATVARGILRTEAQELLANLLARDCEVIIFTSRLCQNQAQLDYKRANPRDVSTSLTLFFRRSGFELLPRVDHSKACIWLAPPKYGKISADLYIDDRAWRYNPLDLVSVGTGLQAELSRLQEVTDLTLPAKRIDND